MKLKKLIKVSFSLIIITITITFMTTFPSLNSKDDELGDLIIDFYSLPSTDSNGDSFIIKYNDVEVLIDAGAKAKSSNEILGKMAEYISDDKKWDYIIATHADEDHIACFAPTSKEWGSSGIFDRFLGNDDYSKDATNTPWTLGTLIDFDFTMDETVEENISKEEQNEYFKTKIYENYKLKRFLLIEEKKITYYPASKVCWQMRGISEPNDAPSSNVFYLDEEKRVKLEIIYNYYYDHRIAPNSQVTSADRNVLSVCVLLTYQNNLNQTKSFLFTGDLEEFDSASTTIEQDGVEFPDYSRVIYGETKLVEYLKKYHQDLLDEGITLYKAGHHGSRTSSSDTLLDAIHPNYVVIEGVAGLNEYASSTPTNIFPASRVIKSILKYTDKIYIPKKATYESDDEKLENPQVSEYYGNIKFTFTGDSESVVTDNEKEKNEPKPIYKTKWFIQNRDLMSLDVHLFDLETNVPSIANCTLIKYGSTEILIDCGVYSNYNDSEIIDFRNELLMKKIKKYCNDDILEYVIVQNSLYYNYNYMIGTFNMNQGDKVESNQNSLFDYFTVKNFIDFDTLTNKKKQDVNSNKPYDDTSWYSRYNALLSDKKINKNKATSFNINEYLSFQILNKNNKAIYTDESDYSLAILVNFLGEKLLFPGMITDNEKAESGLLNKANLKNLTLFVASSAGLKYACSKKFLNTIKPEYTVITGCANTFISGYEYPSIDTCKRILKYANASDKVKKVYLMSDVQNGYRNSICGDICFRIYILNQTMEVRRKSLKGTKATVLLENTTWYQNNSRSK